MYRDHSLGNNEEVSAQPLSTSRVARENRIATGRLLPLAMAGVFDIDIDDGMQRSSYEAGHLHPMRGHLDEDEETNGIDDIELKEEYTHGPDIRAMNASILKDPCYETVELSERTVKGRGGGKAGPQGKSSSAMKYP